MMTSMPPIWKGADYDNGGIFGKRILIVGESTYAEEGVDISQYNILMAQDHIDGYRDSYRTKLLRVFLNREENNDDIKKFWQSVAFFNYITTPLQKARLAPSEHNWQKDVQPLSEILADICPRLIVVVGYRMWDRWSNNSPCSKEEGPVINGAGRENTLYLSWGKGKALSYGLRHPNGRGFSWKNEHPYLMKAIRIA
ncbi:MAG: hypothetical protein B5M56_02985 [Desulfococcus sp. 4484_241]|nr:MAG: hypothetical protein B5M56_02985 [Desulfococcus sp. 4484_241]